jgi:branched-subunit amino acid aminotransferase/4-amino-4-deoxychorismate lyase
MYAYVKNKFVKQSQALLSISERGFRFGDGFFDTILIDNFQPYQWQYHQNKLNESLHYLKLNVNIDYIKQLAQELIAKNQFECGLLRISISRGIGDQGYLPPTPTNPTIVIETIKPTLTNINANLNLWISIFKKIPASSINPNLKLMSGTQNILSKIEALEQNCFEALLLDENLNICEGSSSNIFWIKNDDLFTPVNTCPIYQGSTRAAILNLYPNTKQVTAHINELKNADEIFMTNVAWGIKSINSLINLSAKIFANDKTGEILSKFKYDIKEKTRHLHAWQL